MGHTENILILLFLVGGCLCQEKLVIDTESDIPTDGSWQVSCPEGYANVSTDFNCTKGGAITIPPERLDGELGFWTQCSSECQISYNTTLGDTFVKVRVYQSGGVQANMWVGQLGIIRFGNGWQELSYNLTRVNPGTVRF